MPPTTSIDQTLPPAIKRLQIDMACKLLILTTPTNYYPPQYLVASVNPQMQPQQPPQLLLSQKH